MQPLLAASLLEGVCCTSRFGATILGVHRHIIMVLHTLVLLLRSRWLCGRYVDAHIDLHIEFIAFTPTSLFFYKRNCDLRWHISHLFFSHCSSLSRCYSLSRTSSFLTQVPNSAQRPNIFNCSLSKLSSHLQKPFLTSIPPFINRPNKSPSRFNPRLSSSYIGRRALSIEERKARNTARQRR